MLIAKTIDKRGGHGFVRFCASDTFALTLGLGGFCSPNPLALVPVCVIRNGCTQTMCCSFGSDRLPSNQSCPSCNDSMK